MESTTLLRPVERPCPRGCRADHHGELPGERDHCVEVATIRLDDGSAMRIDMLVRDGEAPVLVVRDPDDNEVRIPDYVAAAFSGAIAEAAMLSWAVAS
ncbi:hypothetical protein [Nonomuraea sp. NPDC023979]|uniref:hypothetical protein n=1 Tax=Nonomuraea sp. NPDC023979 TaxID=3154796 RepID=UPI00340322C1